DESAFALTFIVNGVRQQLLASTGLPVNQHRDIAADDASKLGQHRRNLRISRGELVEGRPDGSRVRTRSLDHGGLLGARIRKHTARTADLFTHAKARYETWPAMHCQVDESRAACQRLIDDR